MSDSFTVLQNRQLSLLAITSCATMDLVAIQNQQDQLFVYRTIEWGLVILKSSTEIVNSNVRSASFTPSGKILAVGGESIVAVLDIESGGYLRVLGDYQSFKSVIMLSWISNNYQAINSNNVNKFDLNGNNMNLECWKFGGFNQVSSVGMKLLQEEGDEDPTGLSLNYLMENTIPDSSLLLVISKDDSHPDPSRVFLTGYAAGIFPLFRVDMQQLFPASVLPFTPQLQHPSIVSTPSTGSWSHITGPIREETYFKTLRYDANGTPTGISIVAIPLSESTSLRNKSRASRAKKCFYVENELRWRSHSASLCLYLHQDLLKLEELITTCGKKWKDATKVLTAKLGLAEDVLKGYELTFSPLKFYYTVAMCGLWHPAAQTCIQQHWNEAGLQRFRVAFETASSFISRTLLMRVIPLATNIHLQIRELLSVHMVLYGPESLQDYLKDNISQPSFETPHKLLSNLLFLRKMAEDMTLTTEDLICESNLAIEKINLFIQFIHIFITTPVRDDPASQPLDIAPTPPTGVARLVFTKLFDPRLIPARSHPERNISLCGAEVLTGTNLFAHFSDKFEVNEDPDEASVNNISSHWNPVQKEMLREILESLDEMTAEPGKDTVEIETAQDSPTSRRPKRLLLPQAKTMKLKLEELIRVYTESYSNRITSKSFHNRRDTDGMDSHTTVSMAFPKDFVYCESDTVSVESAGLDFLSDTGHPSSDGDISSHDPGLVFVLSGRHRKDGDGSFNISNSSPVHHHANHLYVLIKKSSGNGLPSSNDTDVVVSDDGAQDDKWLIAHLISRKYNFMKIKLYSASGDVSHRQAVVGVLHPVTSTSFDEVITNPRVFKLNLDSLKFSNIHHSSRKGSIGSDVIEIESMLASSRVIPQNIDDKIITRSLSPSFQYDCVLEACASRGVLMLYDSARHFMIIDLEDNIDNDEDDEDSGDGVETDEG